MVEIQNPESITLENYSLYQVIRPHGSGLYKDDIVIGIVNKNHDSFIDFIPSFQTEGMDPDRYKSEMDTIHDYSLRKVEMEDTHSFHYLKIVFGKKSSFQRLARCKNEKIKSLQYKIHKCIYIPVSSNINTIDDLEEEDRLNLLGKDNDNPSFFYDMIRSKEWKFLYSETEDIKFI